MDSSFKSAARLRAARRRIDRRTVGGRLPKRRAATGADDAGFGPRTREEKKYNREHRILSAARRLFAQNGCAGTAIEQIAGAAGLAVGTIYNYFPSKNDLLLAILKRETERVLAAGRRVIAAPAADPARAIAALAQAFIDGFGNDDRGLWRELLGAAFSSPLTIGTRLFESDAMLIAQMTELIEALKARGRLAPAVDAGRAAMCVYSLCFTWLTAYLMTEEMPRGEMRQEIRRAIGLIVRGMLRAPRPRKAKQGGIR